ncbi:hypothetical protein [uncultured Microbulbifer sp.]|uniref:hypothetical protein n=1 Tax=uncultured Microbulbifer sp. TaxID=348147 RepID=UPI0025D23ABE|nr:hypothetical protein [uncultured Microbulbifer sp.]
MSEGIATTYAKAIDDLAGKIFIPGLIASLVVELGPWYQRSQEAGLIETYMVFAVVGFLLSFAIFGVLSFIYVNVKYGERIAPILSVFLMPIGFAALFPSYFSGFSVPLSEVSGVAILAWSFVLLGKESVGASQNA